MKKIIVFVFVILALVAFGNSGSGNVDTGPLLGSTEKNKLLAIRDKGLVEPLPSKTGSEFEPSGIERFLDKLMKLPKYFFLFLSIILLGVTLCLLLCFSHTFRVFLKNVGEGFKAKYGGDIVQSALDKTLEESLEVCNKNDVLEVVAADSAEDTSSEHKETDKEKDKSSDNFGKAMDAKYSLKDSKKFEKYIDLYIENDAKTTDDKHYFRAYKYLGLFELGCEYSLSRLKSFEEEYPKQPVYKRFVAKIYLSLAHFEKARNKYLESLSISKDNNLVRALVGVLDVDLTVEKPFTFIKSINNELADSFAQLSDADKGEIYYKLAEWFYDNDEDISFFKYIFKTLDVSPASHNARFKLSYKLSSLKETKASLYQYTISTDNNAGSYHFNNLGWALEQLKIPGLAVSYYRKAYEKDDNPRAVANLIFHYIETGFLSEARELIDECQEKKLEDERLSLAIKQYSTQVEQEKNKFEEARVEGRKRVELLQDIFGREEHINLLNECWRSDDDLSILETRDSKLFLKHSMKHLSSKVLSVDILDGNAPAKFVWREVDGDKQSSERYSGLFSSLAKTGDGLCVPFSDSCVYLLFNKLKDKDGWTIVKLNKAKIDS
jgi:hypothetical protein